MFKTAVSVPAVFGDRPLLEGIRTTGDLNVDGIEFFDWESNDMEEVATACEDTGVSLAAMLSAGAGSVIEDRDVPAMTDSDCTDTVIEDIERSIDACKSVGCPNLIVTTGPDKEEIDRSVQHENIIEVLSAVAPRAEEADVTLVVEPLNTRVDHPGYFLTTSEDAFEIVQSVNSSSVKVLFDVYHQQITEGDVTRRLTENIKHVGHVHIADNPGRTTPGTGELNYENIFSALASVEYEGYVGFEFTPEIEPQAAVQRVTEIVEASHEQ